MKSFLYFALSLGLAIPFVGRKAYACRSASFGEGPNRFVVKSFDFDIEGGQFFVGARQTAKKALVVNPSLAPLVWTSRYASLIFTQIGPDFPFGGMNEAGLTVEALWLKETQDQKNTGKPGVNESQYIQYLLDMADSVEEAIQLTQGLQIERSFAPIHYFICDKKGLCAVAQLTEEGLRMSQIKEPRQQMIENIIHAGMILNPVGNQLYSSFLQHRTRGNPSVQHSFEWLEKVKTPGWTRWQIVYDLSRLQVNFREVNSDGTFKKSQIYKINDPALKEQKKFRDGSGAGIWSEKIFDQNMQRFSLAFPQFKSLVPLIRNYLKPGFK